MEEQSEEVKVVCAANILLENKRKARKLLDEMNEDDRALFMTYVTVQTIVKTDEI